jgi:hypothetical protein
MAIVCLPAGYLIGASLSPAIPIWGTISGAVASFVERYEFGPIDDNVLIVVASSIVLLIGLAVGPL